VDARSRFRKGVVGLAAVAMAAVVGLPQAATAADTTRAMSVAARDYNFSGIPSRLPAASYDTKFFNASRNEAHELVALRLANACQGYSRQQLIDLFRQGEDATFATCPDLGFEGFAFAPPLASDRETLELAPGRTVFVCFIPTAQGIGHFELGMLTISDVFST